jgi:PAS domain S-box-containing protein
MMLPDGHYGVICYYFDSTRLREAEEALRESDASYRSLFESMLDGFAHCRMLFDEHGNPADFVYLEVNNAFVNLTGLDDVQGKKVTEVIPGVKESNPELFEVFGRVALSGQPEKVVTKVEPLGIWISLSVYSTKREHFAVVFDNITEQKQAEESLARAHEQTESARRRLEAILETIPVGVVLIDSANRFALINRRAAEIYGADYDGFDLEEHLAQVKLLKIDGTPFPWEELPVNRARRGEVSHNVEMSIVRANGVRVPIVVNTVPLQENEIKGITAVVTFDDITARKQAEEALRLSEEKFASAFANNPAALALTRLEDGLFYEVNDTWAALNGRTREEAIGRLSRTMAIWPNAEDAARFLKELRSKEVVQNWEQVFHKKSGEPFVAELSAKILTVHGEPAILSTLVDITARKRAEEGLRQLSATAQRERDRLTALINSITDEIWFAEADKKITLVNPAVWKEFGVNILAAEEIAKIAASLEVYRPDGTPRPAEEAPLLRALLGETVTDQEEIIHISTSGQLRHRQVNAAPVRNIDGAIIGSVSVVRDITGQKLAEQAVHKANDELSKVLAERTRELREKEVLLKEVHHRVKNNLQVISSLVGLQADGSSNQTVREVLRDVTYRVRSMALVHEKLYHSASLASIDFAEYAQSLLHYLWRAHGEVARAVRLIFALEPLSLPVDIAVPCGLILNELAGNALKHAFTGRSEGEVAVLLHTTPEGRILLSLRDNGRGLPPELDWRQAGSLGLRLVQMLAGQLQADVELERDGGTEFRIIFRLPEAGHDGKEALG